MKTETRRLHSSRSSLLLCFLPLLSIVLNLVSLGMVNFFVDFMAMNGFLYRGLKLLVFRVEESRRGAGSNSSSGIAEE